MVLHAFRTLPGLQLLSASTPHVSGGVKEKRCMLKLKISERKRYIREMTTLHTLAPSSSMPQSSRVDIERADICSRASLHFSCGRPHSYLFGSFKGNTRHHVENMRMKAFYQRMDMNNS